MGAGGSAIILMTLVISGYLFNLIFHPLRYFAKRAEGQRLFFMSAGTGLVLAAFAFSSIGLLKSLLPADHALLRLAAFFHAAVPIDHANKLMVTLLGGMLLAKVLNLGAARFVGATASSRAGWTGKTATRAQRVYDKLTERHGSPMAKLLRRAVDQQKLVMVTLKSRKIYCGHILEVAADIDAADACLEILPSFSGYRDKDSLKMGDDRTSYPAIDVWQANQRLRTAERELAWLPLEMARLIPRQRMAEMEPTLSRYEMELKEEIAKLTEFVHSAPGGREFDVDDWVKVIPLKDVESASFYDVDAYSAWFSDRSAKKVKSEATRLVTIGPVHARKRAGRVRG